MKNIKLDGHNDLKVYKLSFEMAFELYKETKNFPFDEKYSLTDQLRRASRSIAANIAEAWGKRMYRNHFISKLSDSYAEAHETISWLEVSLIHEYIPKERYSYYIEKCDHICRMLFKMMRCPDKFLIKL